MNTSPPEWLSATELIDAYRSRELLPTEVIENILARAAALNTQLRAFVSLDPDGAMEQARLADAAYSRSAAPPVAGVPVSIKDLTAVRGLKTTFGSRVFSDSRPDYDAIVVERLRAAGACILGKTNTPEFGATFVTDNQLFGATVNPWSTDHSAGGSSGGAAVAVAVGLGPLAHGNDGAGSVRVPASFCGIFGFKPSRGRIPTDPIHGGVNFLHHEGVLARSVTDAALFVGVCGGIDSRDPWSVPYESTATNMPSSRAAVSRIAWCPEVLGSRADPAVEKACQLAASSLAHSLGATMETLTPDWSDTMEPFLLNFRTAGFASMEFNQEEMGKLTIQVRNALTRAKAMSAQTYLNMLSAIARASHTIQDSLFGYDLVLTPTCAETAFRLDDPLWSVDADIPMAAIQKCLFTPAFNISGLPAASLPVGRVNGMPVGLQMVGRLGDDQSVLSAATVFESERPWQPSLRTEMITRFG